MGTLLYMATSEGVVTVKPDGADAWQVDNKGLKEWDVNEIAVEPSAPAQVYAATRGDGVWRSDDAGETWCKPNRGRPGPGKVKCVTIDPHDSNTIWAGTEPIGLWVSHDRGDNWSALESVLNVPEVPLVDYPVPSVEPHVRDVVIDPTDPDVIYLALQVGYMLKSTDRGATWKLLNKDVDADAHTIVSRPDDPKHLYLATGGHSARQANAPGKALYQSGDGGATWSPMAMEHEQTYSIPMVLHPSNPDILFSALASGQPNQWRKNEDGAETTLLRSKDGGASWQVLDTGAPEIRSNYAEAIAIDPDEPDNVFIATRFGQMFRSTDGGDTWASMGVNLPGSVHIMEAVHI